MIAKVKIKKKMFNSIYIKYMLKNENYLQIYFGGSSSGKSYSMAQRTILDVMEGRNYLVARKVKGTIRGSVFNELKKSILNFGLSEYFKINKSDLTITCKINNSQVCFVGLDDVEKVKSITPIQGVFTDVWIEEATEIIKKDLKQLQKRLRGHSQFKKRITLTFNPIHKTHWIYKDYFVKHYRDDKQYIEATHDGLSFSILKTTYKDNEFLDKTDIKNLENETDKYYYEVYTLGNWGVLGNLIFKNWKVEDLSDKIKSFDNIYYGLDWGFDPDPFAFIKFHVDEKRKRLYIFDELYINSMTNDETIALVKEKYDNDNVIIADSAEPKSIDYYKKNGLRRIKGAKKGKGSIEAGIKLIKNYEVIIHKDCLNTKKEFSLYKYKESKDGQVLPKPVDKDNHLIDALRYGLEIVGGGWSFF